MRSGIFFHRKTWAADRLFANTKSHERDPTAAIGFYPSWTFDPLSFICGFQFTHTLIFKHKSKKRISAIFDEPFATNIATILSENSLGHLNSERAASTLPGAYMLPDTLRRSVAEDAQGHPTREQPDWVTRSSNT